VRPIGGDEQSQTVAARRIGSLEFDISAIAATV
jgi:hypothetical protein